MRSGFKRGIFVFLFFLSVFCRSAENSFYFVQITDTHIGWNDNAERLAVAVEAINNLPVDVKFVAVTGDITNKPGKEAAQEAAKILSKFKAPVHVIPGNHDIKDKTFDIDVKIFEENIGPLSSSFDCNGVWMVFFYSEPMRGNWRIGNYNPLKTLQENLQKGGTKPIILFTHAPDAPDFSKNTFKPSAWKPDIAKILATALKPYDVKAIIAGHFHRDDFYWFGDIPIFICGTTSGKGGNHDIIYRLYQYDNGRLSYTTQCLDKNK